MSTPKLFSFQAQERAYRELDRLCYGETSIRVFKVSDYHDCRTTMQDIVNEFVDDLSKKSKYIQWDLAYPEILSDNPREELMVSIFQTELGQRFTHSFANGVLYNFELDKPDPKLTIQAFEPILEHEYVSPEIIEWIEKINDPETMIIKRRFIFKKLSGEMRGKWLYTDPIED